MITLQVVKTKAGRTGVTFMAADNNGDFKQYLVWHDHADGTSITEELDRTKTVIAEIKVGESTTSLTLSNQ
jgi:hypothetical protein